ncbi:MAG: putative RDD family membrane protein YckC [Crocinitomix sp.]|jgi:uncharacterized RDD family membrane protein YckC
MSATIPGVSDRVKAFIMDFVVTVIFMFAAFKIIDSAGEVSALTRRIVFLSIVLVYDPIFTSFFGGTLGHMAFNLRVKKASNPEKNIWLPVAIFRFAIKVLLGWISMLTVSSNSKGQAIHDMFVGSVVIHKKQYSDDSDDSNDPANSEVLDDPNILDNPGVLNNSNDLDDI